MLVTFVLVCRGRRLHRKDRSRTSRNAVDSEAADEKSSQNEERELEKLWRNAYQAEADRAESFRNSFPSVDSSCVIAAPELPPSDASVDTWRSTYEALRDRNRAVEIAIRMQANEKGRAALSEQDDQPVDTFISMTGEASTSPAQDRSKASSSFGLLGEERLKVFGVSEILFLPSQVDSARLSDVGRFRDVLGPGTMPLLTALFDLSMSPQRLPLVSEVREALVLPGSGFRWSGSLKLGRCMIFRGTLPSGGDNSPSAFRFLDKCQGRLNDRFGENRLTVLLQRERYPPTLGMTLMPVRGDFEASTTDPSGEEQSALLLVFLTEDLPIPTALNEVGRLVVGATLAASAALANTLYLVVDFARQMEGDASVAAQATSQYIPVTKYISVARLDPFEVLPVGICLMLVVFIQDFARDAVASQHGSKIRGGWYIPSLVLGTVGRTWSFDGLAPSRKAEIETTVAGASAGLLFALVLSIAGALRGDNILKVDASKLPFLLVEAMGQNLPPEGITNVFKLNVGQLSDAVAAATPVTVPMDPLLFCGSLVFTMQAIRLLPVRGLDGEVLARFLLGPRPTQLLELITGVLLLIGVSGRLGSNVDPDLCGSALLAWAVGFAAKTEKPMPPREDFDDEPLNLLGQAAAAAALLSLSAVILIPGKLVPYGLLGSLEM